MSVSRKSMFKFLGSTGICVFLTTGQVVHAQEVPQEASQEAEADTGPAEIVVTAQKRAQNVQDVPLAITAIGGDELRNKGISSGQDLSKIVPNVSLLNSGGGGLPVVIMRGIGLQNFRVNDSPTTSFYIDEIYQASIVPAEFAMFDLDRVEVLKGPQGGLYGRNTIGGAIQVISKAPKLGAGPNGYVSAGLSSYMDRVFEGGLSVPLGDSAAMRVSGRYEKSDTLYTHSVPGNYNQPGLDKLAGRALLRIEPASNVQLNFKVHGGRDKSGLPLARVIGLYRNNGNAGVLAPNVSLALLQNLRTSGRVSALCASILAGLGSDPFTCATMTGITPAAYGLLPGDTNRYNSATSGRIGHLDTNWWGASMVGKIDLGDFTLSPIVAYDRINYGRLSNNDNVPVEFQELNYRSKMTSLQGELRLAYDGSGPLSSVLGINYAEDKLHEDSLLMAKDGVIPLFFGGAVGSPQIYDQKIKTFSAYDHAELKIGSSVRATGELRYTWSKTDFSGGQQFLNPDGTVRPFYNKIDSQTFNNLSGKLGLDYTVADDVMLFASISRGFKTGGFFGGLVTNPNQISSFGAETIWAYEAGFKSRFWDRRAIFNGSFFYYDRDNVQQTASDPSSVPPIARLSNIGSVRAYGAEFDLSLKLGDNFDFNAGLGLTDSKVSKSSYTVTSPVPTLGTALIEGANTPNYSKVNLNLGGRFHHPVSETVEFRTEADVTYHSSVDLSTITNRPIEGPIFHEPGYALVDLRMGFADRDSRWSVIAFVKNLLDTSYRVEARGDGLYGARELYGAPRTIGVNVTYKFGS